MTFFNAKIKTVTELTTAFWGYNWNKKAWGTNCFWKNLMVHGHFCFSRIPIKLSSKSKRKKKCFLWFCILLQNILRYKRKSLLSCSYKSSSDKSSQPVRWMRRCDCKTHFLSHQTFFAWDSWKKIVAYWKCSYLLCEAQWACRKFPKLIYCSNPSCPYIHPS